MFGSCCDGRLLLRQTRSQNFSEDVMNAQPTTRSLTARARSVFSRRAVQAATLAGIAAVTIGAAAGPSLASTHHIRPNGWAPTEECVNWSGTVKYFPALTSTAKSETAVLTGTLSNCNFDGTGQTYSGTIFGDLTGTASTKTASLSGSVAVAWPADSGLSPTIANISITPAAPGYSWYGTITAGATTGEELWGSYDKISTTKLTGGTQWNILGSAPVGIYENLG
jgi:hypothetical protein